MTIENIKNKKLTSWMNEMIELVKPEKVAKNRLNSSELKLAQAAKCSNSIRKSSPVVIFTIPLSTTSHVLRTVPSSAPAEKRTQVQPTTGWILRNATLS